MELGKEVKGVVIRLDTETFDVKQGERDPSVSVGDYLIVEAPRKNRKIEWTLAQIEEVREAEIPNTDLNCVLKCRILLPLDVEVNEVVNFKPRMAWLKNPFRYKSPKINKAGVEFLHKFFAKNLDVPLHMGELRNFSDNIPVILDGKGMDRHTCFLAQSGSGKSYALGVLIEELLINAKAQIIIIDPNSDFKNFSIFKNKTRKHTDGEIHVNTRINRCAEISTVALDKFKNDFNQHNIILFHKEEEETIKFNGEDKPAKLAISFSGLSLHEMKAFLNLDATVDLDIAIALYSTIHFIEIEGPKDYTLMEFVRLITNIIDGLSREDTKIVQILDPYIKIFGESGELIYALSRLLDKAYELSSKRVWRKHKDEKTFLDVLDKDDSSCIIIDLGELQPDERGMLALTALERIWNRNEGATERTPTFIVIDEAHNIVPSEPEDSWQHLSSKMVNRIAGEGRKYGLFLILVSQSPSKIHQSALSQCDNIIIMKIMNTHDLDAIELAFGVKSKELLRSVSSFSKGDALIIGSITPCPVVLRIGRRRTKEGGSDVKIESR